MKKIEYGAREVKSLIARSVQDPLAEYILDHTNTLNLEVGVKSSNVIIKGKTK